MTDLYLLGTGQRFPDHLTVEVLEVLTSCRRVFTLLADDAIPLLSQEIAAVTTSVWPLYNPSRVRSENYERVIDVILSSATREGPVGWLSLGNPRVLDSVSRGLLERGKELGLTVRALPAISSIDSVLIDVGHDPADGVLVLECTTTVLRQIPLVPHIASVLLQPGTFGTRYPRMGAASANVDLAPLRQHLTQYFSGGHRVAFVISSGHRSVLPSVRRSALEEMSSTESDVLRSSTIFIPPVSRSVIDREFLDTLDRAS